MFIRKTRIVNPKTKEVYYNYQLIESMRTEKGPRQRILLNLGAHLDLDDEERKSLTNRIEELLKGVQSLIVYPDFGDFLIPVLDNERLDFFFRYTTRQRLKHVGAERRAWLDLQLYKSN